MVDLSGDNRNNYAFSGVEVLGVDKYDILTAFVCAVLVFRIWWKYRDHFEDR